MSSSTANLTNVAALKPKASPQPSNPSSVVTLTSKESAAGRSLSPQAAASDLLPGLKGMRSGKVSIYDRFASASWRLLSWISSNSRTFSIAITA